MTTPLENAASRNSHGELLNQEPSIVDVMAYRGRSERIKGFRRIQDAIGDIQGVKTVSPLILLPDLYQAYKTGKEQQLDVACTFIFDTLNAKEHPLIVRRLFPDLQGNAQTGPRSPNISSIDDLRTALTEFYQFFDEHYNTSVVSPELMVHRVIDVTQPPKNADLNLPFPGGDVIQIAENEYQVRATFGADESVQGYPADSWRVVFKGTGEVSIYQTDRPRKTASIVPSQDAYKEIEIPASFQDRSALSLTQVLSIAEVCQRMSQLFSPHRLEFDATRIGDEEPLVIIESAPFELQEEKSGLIRDGEQLTTTLHVFEGTEEFDALPNDSLVLVHLSSEYFQGNHKREALTKLASIAQDKNTKLIVFASGNIATQHAVRVLTDNGNSVLFVGEETFEDGEEINISKKDNKIRWDRTNPFVRKDELQGRTIDKIGGKAKGLQKLDHYGFTTPEFGVIETSFFRGIIEELELTDMVRSLDAVDIDEAEQIASSIGKKIREYDGYLIHDIDNQLKDLFTFIGKNSYAVRSSATCEDGKYSFAGIFDTELNVYPDNISNAILEVLASCLSPEAVRTARSLNLQPSSMEMAIIIQEMVDAKKAGTMFTRDVTSGGSRYLRIDAAIGTGDTIVEGTAERHHTVVVDRVTKQIAEDEIYSAQSSILTETDKGMIIKLGYDIEDSFKEGGQDVEWAIDENGNLLVLQARQL